MLASWEGYKTMWEKGENAGYQHFLLFPTMFSKGFFSRVVKAQDNIWYPSPVYQRAKAGPFPNQKNNDRRQIEFDQNTCSRNCLLAR